MPRKKTTTDQPLTLDASTGQPLPPPPADSPINLHDLEAVRREMGRVYRDMRARRIDSQDGTRMVYALSQIAKLHEMAELERRLKQVEKTYEQLSNSNRAA